MRREARAILARVANALPEEMEAFTRECGAALRDVLVDVWTLAKSLARLFRLVCLPLVRRVVRLVLGQPRAWLVVEGCVGLSVFAAVRLRRWWRRSVLLKRWARRWRSARGRFERKANELRQAYARLLATVAHQSRLLAAALPHLCFCGLVATLLRAAPSRTRAALGSPELACAVTLVRARATHRARRDLVESRITGAASTSATTELTVSANALEVEARARALAECKYWICVTVERFGRGVLYALPYGARLSRGLDAPLAQCRGLALVWLTVFAADGAYSVVARLALTLVPSIVGPRRPTAVAERWRRVWSTFFDRIYRVAALALGDRAARLARFAADAVADADAWLLLLVGLAGLCTIGFVARLAAAAVLFALPALFAIKAAEARAPNRAPLAYFLCLFCADLATLNPNLARLLAWLPFQAHLAIAAALWLQLPYFRGADKLVDLASAKCAAFLNAFKET